MESFHAAIIMDGNGRWATRRGMPRQAGHAAGVEALGRIVEAAPALGIDTLTVYAFSADNWQRPKTEVSALMGLLRRYVETEVRRLAESGTRLKVIGRRDRAPVWPDRELPPEQEDLAVEDFGKEYARRLKFFQELFSPEAQSFAVEGLKGARKKIFSLLAAARLDPEGAAIIRGAIEEFYLALDDL